MKILIVEDDAGIADALSQSLRARHYVVDTARDANTATTALVTGSYDLIILDLGLPDMDGLALLKQMRGRHDETPVLILTAREALEARVKGLDLGADDYIVKPFELPELEARIRAVLRRAVAKSGGELAAGRLVLKPAERRFFVNGQPIDLTPREYGLLESLLLRKGRVVSKGDFQDHLCDWSGQLTENAIELYVHRVRRKIEGSGVEIRTVRGFGYLLQETEAETAKAG